MRMNGDVESYLDSLKTRLLAALLLSALVACDAGPEAPEEPPPLPEREVLACDSEWLPEPDQGVCPTGADPARGLAAFRTACAQCHVRSDGWDLAHFGYSDATIVRRALGHVDEASACSIVAWVRGLDVPRKGRHHRPFRPGCAVAGSDEAFGRQLFPGDRWPSDMTREQLLALRPRELPVALPMLPWSDEASRTDWMPEQPLPEALLAERDGALGAAIDAYVEARTTERLLHAVAVFRELTDGPEGSGRICEGVEGFNTTAEACFQVRKWMAALAGQHVLRFGLEDQVPEAIVDLWWDVGGAEASISSRNPDVRPVHAHSGATWMYLSWSLDPLSQRSLPFYFPEMTKDVGLKRHAVYTMLYSAALASEGPESSRAYELVLNAHLRMPPHWSYDALVWGLNLLLSNHERGLRPSTPEERECARRTMEVLRLGVTEPLTSSGLSGEQRTQALTMIDQVSAGLRE